MSYSYRESHLDKGSRYDETFLTRPPRIVQWHCEKRFLDLAINEFLDGREIDYLDFACGTGRILQYLEWKVSSAVGVDVSQKMLEVASAKVSNATLLCADLTQNDVLKDNKYDLITAFRFFPNAEHNLRYEAMSVLVNHLKDDGILILNNHRNMNSLTHRLIKMVKRTPSSRVSDKVIRDLVEENGLVVARVNHTGVLPSSESFGSRPVWFSKHIEGALSKVNFFQPLAQNLVYVCKKA